MTSTKLGVSTSRLQFTSTFKIVTGQYPYHYHTYLQMEQDRILLAATMLYIAKVGYQIAILVVNLLILSLIESSIP